MSRPPHVQRSKAPRRWPEPPDPHGLSVVLAAILLAIFLSAVNVRVRPVLTALAVTQASNAITATVNDAISAGISSEHIDYGDIVTLKTDANGRVTVLTSNLAQANLLRIKLLERVLEGLDDLARAELSIPLGSLTNLDILFGRGPTVDLQVLSTGTVSAQFEHSFTDAGVNQTLHQIVLHVDVTARVLLPGQTLEVPVSTQVCVAETIIVGEVPATYLQLEQ